MILMLVMFGTAQPSLLAFPEERPVFLREYSTDHYVVGAYFVSRLVLEAVITFVQVMLAVSPRGACIYQSFIRLLKIQT
jgi:ABC-2 type transporter.